MRLSVAGLALVATTTAAAIIAGGSSPETDEAAAASPILAELGVTVGGVVEVVTPSAGRLVVVTPEGRTALFGTPGQIDRHAPGDEVNVECAKYGDHLWIRERGEPPREPVEDLGRVDGVVVRASRGAGRVVVQSPDGTTVLRAHPAELARVIYGTRVSVWYWTVDGVRWAERVIFSGVAAPPGPRAQPIRAVPQAKIRRDAPGPAAPHRVVTAPGAPAWVPVTAEGYPAVQGTLRGAVTSVDPEAGTLQLLVGSGFVDVRGSPWQLGNLQVGQTFEGGHAVYGGTRWLEPPAEQAVAPGAEFGISGTAVGVVSQIDRTEGTLELDAGVPIPLRAHPGHILPVFEGELAAVQFRQVGTVRWVESVRIPSPRTPEITASLDPRGECRPSRSPGTAVSTPGPL